MRALGGEALRRGEVAVLLVAGGQGSRLGFDKPKGMFPVGPVTGATLFQIHAEKVLAVSRRYGRPVPLLVMTSPATHTETEAFFHAHGFFGLARGDVYFFQQGTMPAVDLATGRILLEAPGRLFLSPNGHGGTLTALAETPVLGAMEARGVRHLFYFQVDNPLVKVCDPAFLGGTSRPARRRRRRWCSRSSRARRSGCWRWWAGGRRSWSTPTCRPRWPRSARPTAPSASARATPRSTCSTWGSCAA